MQFSHFAHDVRILNEERLNLGRQRVMVGTLAGSELLRLRAGRVALLRGGSRCFIKSVLYRYAIDFPLHVLYLLVSKVLQSVLEIAIDFELYEISVPLWVAADVPIEDFVVRQL